MLALLFHTVKCSYSYTKNVLNPQKTHRHKASPSTPKRTPPPNGLRASLVALHDVAPGAEAGRGRREVLRKGLLRGQRAVGVPWDGLVEKGWVKLVFKIVEKRCQI